MRDLKALSDGQAGVTAAVVSPVQANARFQPHFAIQLRTLTNRGVSFVVDGETDNLLQAHRELMLALEIPGTDTPSSIFCRVRHRSANGDQYLYGCEYDWHLTQDALGVIEDLAAFTLSGTD